MHLVCTTQNDIGVYVDLIHSEAAHNISQQPQLLSVVKEVLVNMILTEPEVRMERDMDRNVGYDFVVRTADDNAVFYARILHDTIYTRFVKNGQPAQTRYVAFVLHSSDEINGYELKEVRVGRMTPPRPGASGETPESRQYWQSHALVHDNQILQPRTATKECPY